MRVLIYIKTQKKDIWELVYIFSHLPIMQFHLVQAPSHEIVCLVLTSDKKRHRSILC